MSKITNEARVDEELGDEGFEMGQRVYLPAFKQEGTITGMTDLTVEGESWGFRWPGVYRRINVTLDDGMEIREPLNGVKKEAPQILKEGEGILLTDLLG